MGASETKHKPLFVKPSIPTLKFGNYTVTSHEINVENKHNQRIYLLFDPNKQSKDGEEEKCIQQHEYNAVLFLFHGTNEMCYDTELIEQQQRHSPKYTWMDLAMKRNILLIFPQSQTEQYDDKNPDCFILDYRKEDKLRSVWSPRDSIDKAFIYKLKTNVLNAYSIKDNKSYAIGYSNGGIFLCNLLLDDPFLFDVNVSWGGGIELGILKDHNIGTEELDTKLKEELKANDTEQNTKLNIGKWSFYVVKLPIKRKDNKKGKIVIMTGSQDENRTPSYRAWLALQEMGDKYEVRFEDWKHSKHQYRSDATKHIWHCFNSFYVFKRIGADQMFEY